MSPHRRRLPNILRDATEFTLDQRFTQIEQKRYNRGGFPRRRPYNMRQAPPGRGGGRPQRDDDRLRGVQGGRIERRRHTPQQLLEKGFEGVEGGRGGSPKRGGSRDSSGPIISPYRRQLPNRFLDATELRLDQRFTEIEQEYYNRGGLPLNKFVNISRRRPPPISDRDRFVEEIPNNNYNSRYRGGGGGGGVGVYGAGNYRGGPSRRRPYGATRGVGRGGGRGRGRGGRYRNQKHQEGAAAAAADYVIEEKPAVEKAQLDEDLDAYMHNEGSALNTDLRKYYEDARQRDDF